MENNSCSIKKRIINSILPVSILFAMALAGIAVTVMQSLGIVTGAEVESAGLEAYRDLLGSGWFQRSFRYTLYVALFSSFLSVLFGTAGAYLLWKLPPFYYRISLVYKIPVILPHIVVGLIFLIVLGKGAWTLVYFRGSPLLIGAYVYKSFPFVMLMVYSVLRRFDIRLYQTAKMLGENEAGIFRKLVMPEISPVLCTSFIILFLYIFGAFELPFLLGKGNPAMLSIDIYNRFFYMDLTARPHASAALIIMFLFSIAFAALYFHIAGKKLPGDRKGL